MSTVDFKGPTDAQALPVCTPEGFILRFDHLEGYVGPGGDITLPDNISAIRDGAFQNNPSITGVTLSKSINKIEDRAFFNCSGLKQVTLPPEMVSIGEGAFEDCRALTEIVLPSHIWSIHNAAFKNCAGLKRVVLSEDVNRLGAYAFHGCSSLTEVVLSGEIDTIRMNTFSSCSALRRVVLPEGIKWIEPYAFSGCENLEEIVLPESLMSVSPYAFCGCGQLRMVVPEQVEKLPCSAVRDCRSVIRSFEGRTYEIEYGVLTRFSGPGGSFALPDGFWKIGDDVFRDRTDVERVLLPHGVTELGNRAFSGCANLKSVLFRDSHNHVPVWSGTGAHEMAESAPVSALRLGEETFAGCAGLSRLHLPCDTLIAPDSAFAGCGAEVEYASQLLRNAVFNPDDTDEYSFEELQRSKVTPEGWIVRDSALVGYRGPGGELTLPRGLTEIGAAAFQGIEKLKRVVIPEGVTRIRSGAFDECRGLEEVLLPWGVEEIEADAFRNCSSLKRVSLPESVHRIERGVFDGCGSLTEIRLPEKLRFLGDFVFAGCELLAPLTIPEGISEIGTYAFSGCPSVTLRKDGRTFLLEQGTLTRMDGPGGELAIPECVTAIGPELFLGRSDLERVFLPEDLKEIGDRAFSGCENLTEVEFQSSDFYDALAIEMWGGNATLSIGERVFAGCAKLTRLELPQKELHIHEHAFEDCPAEIVHPKPKSGDDPFLTLHLEEDSDGNVRLVF